jgi:hypothetical protein
MVVVVRCVVHVLVESTFELLLSMAYVIHLEVDIAYSLAELTIASSRERATSSKEWGCDT